MLCAFRYIFELRAYGRMKHVEDRPDKAQELYFHSFVGIIIYGHGTLENVSIISCKIVSLLSDTLFLIICEKIILVLCCSYNVDSKTSHWTVDQEVVCWEGNHKLHATLSLVLIGYYVPISVMIAPMWDENDIEQTEDDQEKSCLKSFCSFSSTVSFVNPFLSAITVSKCFMLIGATFISGGGMIGTVVSQIVTMVVLLLFTLIWSFNDLRLHGLTQNKPGFHYGINAVYVVGFCCGLIGCFIEMIRYFHSELLDEAMALILLLSIIGAIGIVIAFIFKWYHSKYQELGRDVDMKWAIRYETEFKVVPLIQNDEVDKE